MHRLPPIAARKFAALQQSERDAYALAQTATKTVNDLSRDLFEARRAENGTEVRRLEHELAAAEILQRKRLDRRANDARVVANLGSWLRALPPGAALEVVSQPALKLKAGESYMDRAERAAATLNKARAELQALQAAPLPVADVKAKATAYAQELARKGAPRISTDRGDLRIAWGDPESMNFSRAAAMAFSAWLDPAAFIARLHAEIDGLKIDDVGAISAADKAERTAALEAEILEAERLEEACISAAQAAGQDCLRRPRANPLAVLGVRISAASRKAA